MQTVTSRFWVPAYLELEVALSLMEYWWKFVTLLVVLDRWHCWEEFLKLIDLEKEWHCSKEAMLLRGETWVPVMSDISSAPPPTYPCEIMTNYSLCLNWICSLCYDGYSIELIMTMFLKAHFEAGSSFESDTNVNWIHKICKKVITHNQTETIKIYLFTLLWLSNDKTLKKDLFQLQLSRFY